MKKLLLLLLAAAVILGGSSPLYATSMGGTTGLGGGAGMYAPSLEFYNDDLESLGFDPFGGAMIYGGNLKMRVNKYLAIRAEGAFWKSTTSLSWPNPRDAWKTGYPYHEYPYEEWTIKLIPIIGSAQICIPLGNRVMPYFGGGAGACLVKEEMSIVDGTSYTDNTSTFIAQAFAGLELFIAPNVSIGGEFKYMFGKYELSFKEYELRFREEAIPPNEEIDLGGPHFWGGVTVYFGD
jgi:opacity protein-like surface antigen